MKLKTAHWWRRKRAVAEQDRLATVEALRKNPHEQSLLGAAEVRYRLRSLVFLVQAVGMALLLVLFITVGAPNWVVMPAIALFAVFWYVYAWQSRLADHAANLLEEAHRE